MNNQMVLDENSGTKCYRICSDNSNSMKSGNPNSGIYEADKSQTLDLNGGNPSCKQGGVMIVQTDRPAVYDPSVHHGYRELGDISETVRSRYGTGGNNVPMVIEETPLSVSIGNGQLNQITMSDKANALDTMHDQQAIIVKRTNCVRRLTPLECERLQGYPDGWTDIPGATDSKRYKALGNSIAIPFWEFLAKRFVSIGGVQTIGSLFDGIGGFPLCFYRAGAKTLWTSEIEPFCEKVVKYHLEKGDL